MIGLALEGGGAKGSYQVGAFMALKKCHIKIDAVTGTSIGSLNGALIAQGNFKKMKNLWQSATMKEMLGIDETSITEILKGNISFDNLVEANKEFAKILKNKGIDTDLYQETIAKNIDEKKVRNSKIKYGLTTLKVKGLKPIEVFIDDIPEGKLSEYIVASSYLPVFKKKKIIDDSDYLDGGFYNLSPVDMLISKGCKTIYVINIKGIGFRKHIKNNDVDIIEIKPNDNLGSMIYFNKDTNEKNMLHGYLDTLRVLGKLDGIDYYFKKRSNLYYKLLSLRVPDNLYTEVSKILGTTSEKDTIIKAFEYILKKERKNYLIIYKHRNIIRDIKKNKSKNSIYRFVSLLGVL